jgi:hypothetical protein
MLLPQTGALRTTWLARVQTSTAAASSSSNSSRSQLDGVPALGRALQPLAVNSSRARVLLGSRRLLLLAQAARQEQQHLLGRQMQEACLTGTFLRGEMAWIQQGTARVEAA